ncbi:MAG: type 4a pilus biogenesis protein PilO, partial [Arenimonas sp.]
LPRVVIMTMHDISLKPRGTNNELLEMAGTIKTYRYLDPDEQAAAPVEGGAP